MNKLFKLVAAGLILIVFVMCGVFIISSTANAADTTGINNANAYDNNATNNQSAAQSNTMINHSNYNRHSYGQGITCSENGLFVSGYDFEGGQNAGIQIGYNHVFGKKSCRKMAAERTRQIKLDTDLEIVERCISYKERGIMLDVNVFPWAEKCTGLGIVRGR
jgi:hypothetical protein